MFLNFTMYARNVIFFMYKQKKKTKQNKTKQKTKTNKNKNKNKKGWNSDIWSNILQYHYYQLFIFI